MAATGGPNGVLAVQRSLIGTSYRGFKQRYYFEPRKSALPPTWEAWVKKNELATMSRKLLAAHNFVQNSLNARLPRSFQVDNDSLSYFICHDTGAAVGAHLCGYPYSLIYHQQGAFVHERTSFGETLNEQEISIMNYFEKTAFENADRVFFPSKGAQESFFDTTTCVDKKKVKLADYPMYNTVLDFDVSHNDAEKFIQENSLENYFKRENRDKYTIFISVGDYTENKGIDRCPEVLSKIAGSTDKKVLWICIGSKHKSGIYDDIVRQKDAFPFETIPIPYRIPHATAMALVQKSDWLLMLHRHSIFDFSSLEAMKMETGLILSPVGGNLEFNTQNNVLYLDPDKASPAEIEKIVAADPKAYGVSCRQAFEASFSESTFQSRYLTHYDDVITRYLKRSKSTPISTKDRSTLSELFAGKHVLICGAGSSVKQLTADDLDGKLVVALNKALLLDLNIDIHIMQDEPLDEMPQKKGVGLKSAEIWEQYLAKDVVRLYGKLNRQATRHLALDFERLDSLDVDYLRYDVADICFDFRKDKVDCSDPLHEVLDMRGVLFSAIQIAAKFGASSISLAGIDFSTDNFHGKNPNKYNELVFKHLAEIAYACKQAQIPLQVVCTSSDHVRKIVATHGESGVPEPIHYSHAIAQGVETFEQTVARSGLLKRCVLHIGRFLIPEKIAIPLYGFLRDNRII